MERSFPRGDREVAHPVDPSRRLLRAHGKRPRRRRAAYEHNELAPFHSITSSAWARSDGGMVMPSAFALARFTTNSNLVGCWTGRSEGLVPLRILSTWPAARLIRSNRPAP